MKEEDWTAEGFLKSIVKIYFNLQQAEVDYGLIKEHTQYIQNQEEFQKLDNALKRVQEEKRALDHAILVADAFLRHNEKKETTEELIKRTREWINSEEWKKTLMEAGEKCAKRTAELREARKVNPEDLHKPCTI
jgi:hypothetical protein